MSDQKPSSDDTSDSNKLWRSIKIVLSRAKRVFNKKWPAWLNWLCVAVIVPALGLMGRYIYHLSSTIDDIRQEQKLTASEQKRELQESNAELAKSLRAEFVRSERDAFSEAANRQKAFELLIADLKSAQQLHQAHFEKDVQALLARQKEAILQEQRVRIDGLQLFADAFELAVKMCDANDARRYRDTITLYQDFSKKTTAKDIPQAMRRQIYREAARAFSIQGAYESITDDEFAEMQRALREEAPGNNLTHLYVATIHFGKGQVEKARSRCKLGVEALIETEYLASSRYVCAPYGSMDLSDYYGLLILIELFTSNQLTEQGKLSGCWSVLDTCEEKAIVYPGSISERLGRSSLLTLSKHLGISQPGFDRMLKKMMSQLQEFTYQPDISDAEIRGKPGEPVKCRVKRVKIADLKPIPLPKE